MKPKILLVEDEPDLQSFAQAVFETNGMAVVVCGTTEQAWEAFRASRPDLVVLDIGLPDGSGVDLCRRLSAEAPNLPIIFVTARSDMKTRLDGFSAGAHDYIQKPFAVPELMARVLVHLRLKKKQEDLAKANYDLTLRERARQDMTDMIVHDLRTPLTSIKGTLELIRSRGLISDADHKRLLENADTAAQFMLLMLNDLLDVSHAGQQALKAKTEQVGVPPFLDKLKTLFSGRVSRLGVNLSTDPDGVRMIEADPSLLFRVLVNLVSNAIGVSARGKQIAVSCAPGKAPKTVRFAVADEGPGVPNAEKEKIFDKFRTGKPRAMLSDGGAGLGLTFCRLAATAHGGRIWVEDRPGGGSLFLVEIPTAA